MKKKIQKKTKYFSQNWQIEVRPEIAKEFIYDSFFDDNLAGLHEIRARMSEKNYSKKLSSKTA
ncbi:hypothetical protein HY750_01315 [Candidatus Kuenenbacteria bacterium]|nr:hypothetical protein [Candidatus Kuenenbacteria bacterium]